MTDKELVERLRLTANCMMDEWEPTLCKRSEFITAADRIEQLHAELTNERIANTNLIGELATVAAERDRYKAERENHQPLNLEELRRMDGEVVYIPESEEYFGGMGIVSVSQERVVDVGDPKFGYWPFREYGEGWRAYRSKPKEGNR